MYLGFVLFVVKLSYNTDRGVSICDALALLAIEHPFRKLQSAVAPFPHFGLYEDWKLLSGLIF